MQRRPPMRTVSCPGSDHVRYFSSGNAELATCSRTSAQARKRILPSSETPELRDVVGAKELCEIALRDVADTAILRNTETPELRDVAETPELRTVAETPELRFDVVSTLCLAADVAITGDALFLAAGAEAPKLRTVAATLELRDVAGHPGGHAFAGTPEHAFAFAGTPGHAVAFAGTPGHAFAETPEHATGWASRWAFNNSVNQSSGFWSSICCLS